MIRRTLDAVVLLMFAANLHHLLVALTRWLTVRGRAHAAFSRR